MKLTSKLFYLSTGLFGLIGSIVFWTYVWNMEGWYPIVGAFVASHGALFGSIALFLSERKANKE